MKYDTYYDEDPLIGAQNVMLDMMKAVHDICESHNISYWLEAGSLLGAVRHKGFIPWDDDSDLGFLREDYDKFIKIAKESLPAQYKLETKTMNIHGKHNWGKICFFDDFEWIDEHDIKRRGISIDIFPYDYVKKDGEFTIVEKLVHRIARIEYQSESRSLKDKLSRLINNMEIQNFYKKFNKKTDTLTYGIETTFYGYVFHDVKDVFPLKKAEFSNFDFYIPNNADTYLTKLYGDYMALPEDSEKRIHMQELSYIKKGD